jgi:hypothetical protein
MPRSKCRRLKNARSTAATLPPVSIGSRRERPARCRHPAAGHGSSEARRIPHGIVEPEPNEPVKVALQPLHQLAFRADRAEGLQEHGPRACGAPSRAPHANEPQRSRVTISMFGCYSSQSAVLGVTARFVQNCTLAIHENEDCLWRDFSKRMMKEKRRLHIIVCLLLPLPRACSPLPR